MINDHLAYEYVEPTLTCIQLCGLKAGRWKQHTAEEYWDKQRHILQEQHALQLLHR